MRTPTVLQMEAVECGAASLAIVLGHYGKWVPLEELRGACGVSRDGANAQMLLRAARTYGMDGKAFRYGMENLSKQAMPVVVFWNFNHYVVVEGIEDHRVFINDPATGPRVVGRDEFERSYTGVMLELRPGERFVRSGRPPSLWGAVWDRLRGERATLAAFALASVLLAVPAVVTTVLARVVVERVVAGGQGDWVGPLIAVFLVTLLLQGTLTMVLQAILRRLETKLAVTGASRLLWHLVRLPFAFFTQRMPGDLVSRLRSNDTVAALVGRELGTTVAGLVGAVVFVAVMAAISPLAALATAALSTLSVVVTLLAQRRIRNASLRLEMDEAKVFVDTVVNVHGIETIKATGIRQGAFNRWAGHHATTINEEQRIGRHNALLGALPPLTSALMVTAVLALAAFRAIEGALGPGDLVAVLMLLVFVRAPVERLAAFLAEMETARSALMRIGDVLAYEPDPVFTLPPPPVTAVTGRARLSGRIELRGVTFGYNRHAPPLIEGLDLVIAPGQRIALVGGTGSGKSTVARLVAGLYRPWGGTILFDGIPVDEIPLWLRRQSIGWVDQEVALFTATVSENLTLWDATVPEEVVTRAARDAAIHSTIAARPGGYGHRVLEGGTNFSGGEAQRLQIARALALDPSILILDEATSALDPLAELDIDANLRRRGCTAIIVAHRLSTIRDCDEIIVMDRGKPVERGTHESLYASGGRYRDLVQA